jgi:carboxyl-terminal processing protease
LSIENKRRKAEGEELLTSLENTESNLDGADPDVVGAAIEHDDKDDKKDVLLQEAANVLVDMLTINRQNVALRQEN